MTDSRDSRIARLAVTGLHCRHVLAALTDWTLANIDNSDGPVRAWSDPLANESRIAIMRNYHERIEHDFPENPS